MNKKLVHHSPPTTAKLESSDEESPSWEIVNKDEMDTEDSTPLKRQLSVSSSGSFTHRSSSSREPGVGGGFRRRNRSSTREEKGTNKHPPRSSSLQSDNRARSDWKAVSQQSVAYSFQRHIINLYCRQILGVRINNDDYTCDICTFTPNKSAQ